MTTTGFKRKLSAILMADVVGYSRLMGEDEVATLKTLSAYQGVMAELIRQHRGRVVDAPGDAVLAEFSSVVDAVQCAVAVQQELKARNDEVPEDSRMAFRIGINLGDVIEEGDKIYGDGVNIAARLEALADPGGICISKTAFDHIETKLPLGYEFLGEQSVKNIAKPVGAYRVMMEPRVTVVSKKEKVRPEWQAKPMWAAGLLIFMIAIALVVWHFSWFSSGPPVQVAPRVSPPPAVSPPPPSLAIPPSPAPAPSPQPPKRQDADFMKKFDWNRDGKVSRDEFMIRREAQFNQLDTNKDGNLSKKEVSAVKNRFARKLGQAFHRVDKDNNQLISGKEFQERSKRQFLKLDLNRDGTITEDELAKVSRNDSSRK